MLIAAVLPIHNNKLRQKKRKNKKSTYLRFWMETAIIVIIRLYNLSVTHLNSPNFSNNPPFPSSVEISRVPILCKLSEINYEISWNFDEEIWIFSFFFLFFLSFFFKFEVSWWYFSFWILYILFSFLLLLFRSPDFFGLILLFVYLVIILVFS